MAELELVDPPPFAVVFVAFNTFFNLSTADGAAPLPRAGRGAARARGPVRARGVRAGREPTTHPPAARVAPRRITADEVVLSVSQHDADAQTVTGQHIHVTEAGIRLRPWHLRYAVSGRSSTPWPRPPASGSRGATAGWDGRPFTADASVHVSAYDRGNVRAVRSPGSAAP